MGPQYPSTAWSIIRGAQGQDVADHERALGRLASVYWRPIYWTLRRDWNASSEEAKDLTQEYFATFLEKRMFDEVARERGRFRAYVKATLKNFVLNQRRAEGAVKRGCGRPAVPIEDLDAIDVEPEDGGDSSELIFERQLMRAIVQRALVDLEEACERRGKREHYVLFRAYYYEESAGRPVQHEDLRRRFGLGAHEVKNRLADMRTRFRKVVLGYLRDGITSEQDLVSEIREVFES